MAYDIVIYFQDSPLYDYTQNCLYWFLTFKSVCFRFVNCIFVPVKSSELPQPSMKELEKLYRTT